MGLSGGLASNGGAASSGSSSSSSASRSWLGLNSNSLSGFGPTSGVGSFVAAGIVYDRLEFTAPASVTGASTTGVTVATSIGLGMKPVILLEPSTYGGGAFPTGGAITTFANYVVNAIQTLEGLYGGRGLLYEIMNEPWTTGNYSSPPSAAVHADAVVGVINACIAAGLDMTRIYVQAQHATYVGSMYTQQPTLATKVQGWATHPYGTPPPGYASGGGQGVASLLEFRKAIASGANNILVSEIGVYDFTVGGASLGSESTAWTSADAQRWVWQILDFLGRGHADGWLTAAVWFNRNSTGWATHAAGGAVNPVGTALLQYGQPAKSTHVGDYSVTDDGMLAQTMDPAAARDGVQPTSGKLLIARIRTDERYFAQRFILHVTVAGATLTAGQSLVGIYDELGNLQDTSADQSASWTSTGRKNVTGWNDNFRPGTFYIAILSVGTTPPTFAGASVATLLDGNGAVAPTRAMVGAATGLTALPATLALGSQTPSQNLAWVALSA